MKCISCHGDLPGEANVCPLCGAQAAVEPVRFAQLKKVFSERYDFIRLLGIGGFAEVYLAKDKLLEREVAIKILLPQHGQDPQTVERFLREARLYAKLEHRNIIPIYDTGILAGHVFITMKYIRGESLKHVLVSQERIASGQLPGIIRGVAQALDYIHRQGIVHRDIKPANIIVEKVSGAVYLADFGIARAESSQTLTQTGMIIGTPFYLSPEQIKGRKTDQRSDIYALGATLYELAAGEPPFQGDSPLEILYQHINENAVSLDKRIPNIDPVVAGIIARCIEKDPARRFQNAGEILARLDEGAGAGAAALDRFEPTVLTARPRLKRGNGRWIAAVLLLCVMMAGGIYFLRRGSSGTRDVAAGREAAAVVSADLEKQARLPVAVEKKEGPLFQKPDSVSTQKPIVPAPEKAARGAAGPGTADKKQPKKEPSPAAATVEVPVAATTPGTVQFSSFPPLADVYYGTEKLGNTEQRFERKFPPGDHRFTFSIPGYRSAEVHVRVEAGATAGAHFRFPPFRGFTITARPFGRVFIDGVDRGDTPQTVKLAYGEHLVWIAKDGYQSQEQKVTIDAGSKNSIYFELIKEDEK